MPLYSDSATVQPPRAVMGFADAAKVTAEELAAFRKPGAALGFAELKGFRYPIKQYAFRLSPTLARGALADAACLADLKSQGFKSVVSLCAEVDESAAVKSAGLLLLRLELPEGGVPSPDQLSRFLAFVTNRAFQQIYLHGKDGAGRTSVLAACYRMAVQRWPADAALTEAEKFGLTLDAQIDFLKQFDKDLHAGRIEGYPL